MEMLTTGVVIALLAVLAAEFVNGWTDAPNAVATVVSTGVMTPRAAIAMAVVLNTAGAMAGTAVATTVGAIKSGDIPQAFYADLAYLVYEATKAAFYDTGLRPAYVPPFRQLIGDVNAGKVGELTFVRKYGAAGGKWGAEFTVNSPANMKEKYEDKAVLHTHYAAADEKRADKKRKSYDSRLTKRLVRRCKEPFADLFARPHNRP